MAKIEPVSTLIFELKHQQVDYPDVPHPTTRIFIRFGSRGVFIQVFPPSAPIALSECLDIPTAFTTLIDVLYLTPQYEELQMELKTLNGEEIWVVPEIEE
jgi:hypothetical protein